jgi:signal transduction histidine kinase/FixJ family two-component response regulator
MGIDGGFAVPKEKILIADDMPDILELCTRIIRSEGYEVTGVSTGEEAIEAAKQEHYDLFLTDMVLPGIRGLETTQVIREFQPDIVCVVMTGYGTMDTAIQALKLGFSEFVVKPFKPQDLKLAVSRALEKERLRRENARLSALVPLFEINKTLMTTVEEDELAVKVLQAACDELGATQGVLMLRGRDQRLSIRASTGFDMNRVLPRTKKFVLRTAEVLLRGRQQVLVQTAAHAEPRVARFMRRLKIESFMFSPLLAMDAPVGALMVANSEPGARFAPGDSELLSVLCGQAAIAFQNASLFEQVQRAYQELQELDNMKSEFINVAAHELRTPLAILIGHVDLLMEGLKDPKLKGRLQIILRNALRLRKLVGTLLNMRYLQTGEGQIQVTACRITDLISDAIEDLKPMAEGKDLHILVDAPPGLAPIRTDSQKILFTLTNLIHNAIKFTPQGGQIGIDVSEHGEELWVSVWDTGIGIPSEEFERIFLPFYQVEPSLTREHEGIGLGLSIAKGMVERCHGKIWVESELERGSRFTFTLPRRSVPVGPGHDVQPLSMGDDIAVSSS